jgi:uncharacterized membrane protein YeiH
MPIKFETDKLLFTLDMVGTLVFAVEGAEAAIAGELDLWGLMLLAFATALGGGVIRDLLIGAISPTSLRDWRDAGIAFAGGALAFFLHRFVEGVPGQLLTGLDAAGLTPFGVAGTQKALNYKMHPFIAVLQGTITGVGGGTMRDVLLTRVPTVLRADVYATAALAGSVIFVVSRKLGVPSAWAAVPGGTARFLLRVVSVWQHWNLPRVAT